MKALRTLGCGTTLALLAAAAWAGKAHVHGVVAVDATADGGAALSVQLDAPLDSLVGYERRPRSAAERAAADAALASVRSGGWVVVPAAAGCTLAGVEVDAPVLQATPAPNAAATPAGDGHAELAATATWRCRTPAALQAVELALFERFARIQRIDVQVAGPAGQLRHTLRRPARTVPLRR
jgi:hypothetical protein